MRLTCLIICSLFFFMSIAQETETLKYPSLFWKIEKEGMEKPSYLYGTMHVSARIAYRLSDPFYEALMEVDKIALETNPEDWIESMLKNTSSLMFGYSGSRGKDLYNSFLPTFTEKETLEQVLRMDKEIVNGFLYRNSMGFQDFEEETYLDMFLFQAGRKLERPVIALEDLDQSEDWVQEASRNIRFTGDGERPPWLEKLLREKGFQQLLEDAYRDQNLDMIDSLHSHFYPEKFNEYMLYKRNRVITNSIDTAVKNASLLYWDRSCTPAWKRGRD